MDKSQVNITKKQQKVLDALMNLQFAKRKEIIEKTGLPGSYVSTCLNILMGKKMVDYIRMKNTNKTRIWQINQ